jgi:hypothetical protein
MNLTNPRSLSRHLQRLAVAAAISLLLNLNPFALAAPGAHGPNGEHLDAPSTTYAASTLPRLEATSETFELVAELRAEGLVIVVDRYETNEPVLGAKLEVESGGVNGMAAFRPEQGDYVVTDAALLKALAAPGEHGLVFMLVAGSESDLLDGTLVAQAGRAGTAAAALDDHGHSHDGDNHGHDHDLERAVWIGGGIAAVGLLGGVASWRQRRRSTGQTPGVL